MEIARVSQELDFKGGQSVTTATPSTTYARDRHLSRGRHVTYLGLENLDEGVDVG